MNFLAHLYIANQLNDSLIGHFLGDFVKGRRIKQYSREVQAAILFHRKIDSFSDAHAMTRKSRERISRLRRRFAGVIVDVCYDHFLARHWHRFSSDDLYAFTQNMYSRLKADHVLLNDHQKFILDRMINYDWLSNYYRLEHVGTALDRIAGRLTRGQAFVGSLAEIKENYQGLERDFKAFFPELVEFSVDYKRQMG